jgi:phosphocarrier protein HPr
MNTIKTLHQMNRDQNQKDQIQYEVVKGGFVVLNDRGLHTRPSTELVKLASTFRSEITLIHKKLRVNAKSILGILMLGASKGSRIRVEAVGSDAEKAIEGLAQLAEKGFHIHY